MCNLYNLTTNQEAIRSFVAITHDRVGNMEPSIDVYPDRLAPIVRNMGGDERELAHVRWGMPSSKQALYQAATRRADKLRAKGKEVVFDELLRMEPDGGTTNIRNTDSKHWTRWFGIDNRCVVPVSKFAEPDPANKKEGGRIPNAWFEGTDAELMFFAGVWIKDWSSVRKVKDGLVTTDLYAFLTTAPNRIVGDIHEKAMPVLLTTKAEVETWLSAPWEVAKALQRALPDDKLRIVRANSDGLFASRVDLT